MKKHLMKINKKDLILIISVIVLNTTIYIIGRTNKITPYVVTGTLDSYIPFIKWFIYPYVSWYLLIFLMPLLVSIYDKDAFYKYITFMYLSLLVTLIVYIFAPTIIIREDINLLNNTLTDRLITHIYNAGSTLASAPSLHVLLAFGFMMPLINGKKVPNIIRIIGVILGLLIILATVFIKQHALIDVVTSIFIVIVCYFITKVFKLDKYIKSL